MQIYGRTYDTNRPVRLDIESGIIGNADYSVVADEKDKWPLLAPGLVDLQTNGFNGQEFGSPDITPDKLRETIFASDSLGVTQACPTLITNSFEVLRHSVKTIARACDEFPEIAARIPGIHLEGPFITQVDGPRGAHPIQHCRSPDWDEFQSLQDAADGRVVILTMSPEYDGAIEFIKRVVETGVIVSIGHAAATSDQIRAAIDAGARMSTHLGNGSHLMIPRHQNYLWPQLADDRVVAGLICDGFHLPPDVIKCFVRAKGLDNCVLVSDVSGLAGLPPGRYEAGHGELEILPNGKIVVAGQTELLAGASLPLGVGIVNVMDSAGVSLEAAVNMATKNPARLIGMDRHELEPGSLADLVLFDLVETDDRSGKPKFVVRATVNSGQVVAGELWQPK